ncbi:MAG: Mg(2+) chelatase family protein, partial [Candidatus Nomurabacteria bacterium GW2011_GWD2_39_12]
TEEVLEITGIHSVAGNIRGELVCFPPFRAPHHTSSYVSIVGGGTYPKPGEVTLAHRGVLFLKGVPLSVKSPYSRTYTLIDVPQIEPYYA